VSHPIYWEFELMRNVYHCTPSELDEQDASIVELHTHILSLEARERRISEKSAGMKQKYK
jgi:hypothetical protein